MFVVHAMLGNAAVAAVLALLALAIGLACRSASIRHAAWVLVLLKLVTPPLFSVPLPLLPASWEAEPPANELSLFSASSSGTNRPPIESATSEPLGGTRYRLAGVADWALAAWVVGTVAWFVWQGRRIESFRRRVGRAEKVPPEVAEAASRIAASLGIANPPEVKLATGIGSPMLWGWGRSAVVLFPRDLLARLSPEARDTLLGHELAHFLRRDHWVRVLEFLATGLYWWHPAVWLARMGLEAAEEECCDAWVVGGLAASPRRYAEALLATVDFEAELRRPCLPPGACAANRSARLLQRRLVMLLDASRPGRLRGGNAIRLVLVAALFARPVFSAATPEAIEPTPDPTVAEVPRQNLPENRAPIKVAAEPRAWATAAAPGGILTVLARDREVVLRRPDGTTRVLGPGRPLAVSFAPGGQRLATAGPGTRVRTWNDRGELLVESHAPDAARAIAYTPDGTQLLILDAAGGMSVLDPQTLAVLAYFSVEAPANSIAISPDGRTVAVSFGSWRAETGRVECWSIAERRKLATYSVSAPVGAAGFAPDGRTLVVGGWNGTVFWLSLPSGQLLAERQLTKDLAATAAFCPDAGTLPLEPPPIPPPLVFPELFLRPVRMTER